MKKLTSVLELLLAVLLAFSGCDKSTKSDPDGNKLSLLSTYELPGSASGIALSGNYAYVVGQDIGLRVFNISDPGGPVLISSLSLPSPDHIAIQNNYAFAVSGQEGMRIINIEDPTMPTIAAVYDPDSWIIAVYPSGSVAFVSEQYALGMLNINNPTQPVRSGGVTIGDVVQSIFVLNNYAYLAAWDGGLVIVDLQSYPPSIVGRYDGNNFRAWDVYVLGNYAYNVGLNGGVVIVDVTDPANPALVSNYFEAGQTSSIFVAGQYAYVTSADQGLLVLDVSDPSNQTLSGNYQIADGHILDLAVLGNYIYTVGASQLMAFEFTP